MRPLLAITCAILLADNFIGASQFKLSKATLGTYANRPVSHGEDERYVPAYYKPNPYPSYQQLLANYESEQLEQEERQAAREAAAASKFPSIVSPSISLNGHNSLSKYKQSQAQATNPEFHNLLASIKAIQPVVDERLELLGDYIKEASRQQAFERSRNLPREPQVGQQEYSYFGANVEDGEQEQGRQGSFPFQAENMANPYDEIQEASLDTSKRMKPISAVTPAVSSTLNLREPKARRKLTSSVAEPSRLQNSHNLVLSPAAYQQPIESAKKESLLSSMSDVYFVAIVACVSSVAIFSVIGAGYCFYKVQQSNKTAQDVEFPTYGVIGPASRHETNGKCPSPPADRKMAQSAQMYHYHHQKQQMISNDKSAPRHNAASDVESDEENEDGEYTVYECPGLAPTGEMEVKNPLFQDDLTPMSSPSVNGINKQQDSPKGVKGDKSEHPKGSAKSENE